MTKEYREARKKIEVVPPIVSCCIDASRAAARQQARGKGDEDDQDVAREFLELFAACGETGKLGKLKRLRDARRFHDEFLKFAIVESVPFFQAEDRDVLMRCIRLF